MKNNKSHRFHDGSVFLDRRCVKKYTGKPVYQTKPTSGL